MGWGLPEGYFGQERIKKAAEQKGAAPASFPVAALSRQHGRGHASFLGEATYLKLDGKK